MRLITEKLHSGRGASILMALVFFLLCGFVGAVILGSATANAQKVQDRREDQQAYHAVSSAARLLRDTLQGSACKGWEDKITFGCGYQHPEAGTHRCGQEEFWGKTGKNLLTEAAWNVFCRTTGIYPKEEKELPYVVNFTVQAGEDIPDVNGTLTMDEKYNMTIVLSIAGGSQHQMTLLFTASVIKPQEILGTTSCWHDEGAGEDKERVSYTGSTQRQETSISWPTAVISKGDTTGEVPHG